MDYKPIGIATSGISYFEASNANAGPGIVFATGDSNFGNSFVKAIAKQRFWYRDIY